MAADNTAYESWRKLLSPSLLKSNLISMALFIAAYELCEDVIIEKLQTFFSDGFNENGLIIGKTYNNAVQSNLNNKFLTASLLKNKPLAASLGWLNTMGAIEGNDIKCFVEIRDHRNEITHEMLAFLSNSYKDINHDLFSNLLALVDKIGKWWLLNFEAAIDPDIVTDGTNIEDVVPGPVWGIQLMLDIALGREPEEGFYLSKLNEIMDQKS